MGDSDKDAKVSVLLAEYQTVSQEMVMYISETMRCFLYGAALAAIYAGIRVASPAEAERIQTYVPYAFVILVLYFLAMSTIRINLTRQRADLERKLNALLEEDLITWDSQFASRVQTFGFIRWGPSLFQLLPTPIVVLGLLIVAGSLALFTTSLDPASPGVVGTLLVLSSVLTGYVFFVFPRLSEHAKQNGADWTISYNPHRESKQERTQAVADDPTPAPRPTAPEHTESATSRVGVSGDAVRLGGEPLWVGIAIVVGSLVGYALGTIVFEEAVSIAAAGMLGAIASGWLVAAVLRRHRESSRRSRTESR